MKFVEVESISEVEETFDVFDITVDENHNFYANGMLVHNCIGGPLAWEVFQEVQGIEFDSLHWSLLNDRSLMERSLARIGNTYGRLTEAVGRQNVHLELQFNKLPAQHLVNRAIIEFARRENLTDKLIVTCDSHYARPEYWREREIYKKLGRMNFETFDPESIPKSKEGLKCELYPKNAIQVWETYKETGGGASFYEDTLVKEAIERTWHIAHEDIGDIQPDREVKLPSYVIPEGKTATQGLAQAVVEGLKKKGLQSDPVYVNRAKYELSIIRDKNFSEYFLTMKEIIRLAKEKMMIGPGRGSAASSVVCYVLGITDVDPIKYDLLFERFISPDREGLPDIDTDVENRDLLLEILRDNFGGENIIPISNYNTFKLKSLIRDVSRFYSVPLEEVNSSLRTVEKEVIDATKKQGDDKSLFVLTYEDSCAHSPSFREFIEKYPHIGESVKVLFKQNKSLGRHAGGVIVSERIGERMPLITARGEMQTPWVEGMNFKHLEMLGWVKFDLLGLATLRIIRRAIELILQRHCDIKNPTFKEVKAWFDQHMSPENIDFNDQRVYENVYHQATTRSPGVFQLTSAGAQRLFQRGKPKNLVDIATLTSIYRPGPLAAKVDKIYLEARANPENIDYKHPLIKQVLEPTYGCIIFQESLMALCNVVAGFPKSECDKVRKNVLKRQGNNAEESLKKAKAMKESFVVGSVKNGVNESVASKLWDDILFFAGYGFNLTVHYETEVNTYSKEGKFLATKQIQYIDSGEYLKSRDESTGSEIFVEVVQRHDHGVQDLYEVTLDTGETVKCSLDHKFRTTDGQMLPLSQIVEMGLSIVTAGSPTNTKRDTRNMSSLASLSKRSMESRGSSAKSVALQESRWESISAALTV